MNIKSKYLFFSFIMINILISCNNGKTKNLPKNDISEEQNLEDKKLHISDITNSLLNQEINVQNIKSQLDGVNTTFLSKENILFYTDRKKDNLYGDYTLIKNDEGGTPTRIVGHMIVYDSINPYKYGKNTDDFVEITLKSKGVELFEGKLEVGVTKYSSILKNFGKDYIIRGNTLIYSEGNKFAFFKMQDSIVSKLKIGIYKRDVSIDDIISSPSWY